MGLSHRFAAHVVIDDRFYSKGQNKLPDEFLIASASVLFMEWTGLVRTCLLNYVFMAFAFRSTTLHLRPVDAASSPHRLTIRSLILLTTLVAFSLCIDGLASRLILPNLGVDSVQFGAERYFVFLMSLFYGMATALLWFSFAWLFVDRSPRRWFGGLGVIIYVMYLVLNLFVLLPIMMRMISQATVPAGAIMPTIDLTYTLGQFAIGVLHIGIVFLCVGMMHLAGYRWDVRRLIQIDDDSVESTSHAIPPLLVSRTFI